MKVLMTADAVGGVWTYALDLARGLADEGVSTVLAVLGPDPAPNQSEAARAVPGLTLVPTGLPLDWTATCAADVLAAGRAVAALATEHGVDLVHLNSPALAAERPFDRPVLGACHSCLATWWAANRTGPMPSDFRWRTELVAAGYRAADRLVAPSHAFAGATARTYALDTPPSAVPNGRRPAEPGTTSKLAHVFTAGRLWDAGKNPAALDRLAGRLDVPLVAAGPLRGPNGTAFTPSRFYPVGSITPDEVSRYLASRPIFVSLARYEPFGLAVLEAAQAGCALVLSDIPTFREVWSDSAFFVAPDDDEQAAATINGLLADPGLREALGETAQERGAMFTAERMAAGTLAIYRDVLAGWRSEAA